MRNHAIIRFTDLVSIAIRQLRHASRKRGPLPLADAGRSAMWIRRAAFAATALLLGSLACEGDGKIKPETPVPTTVTVTPATPELAALAATVQLSAQVLDQHGHAMANASVSWTSDDTEVAAVAAAGLVTAAGNGTASITATAGAASGSAAVTVAQAVSVVAVTAAADSVLEADTVRFTARAADANDHAVEGAQIAWSSSDTLVAVVNDSGLVTGVADGGTEITATSAGVTGSAGLTVVEPVPTSVSVTPDMVEFTALGQTAELSAEVRNQIGRVMDGVTVSWTSTDTSVAIVDASGLVTAAGNGSATVTAAAGDASGTSEITVDNPERAALTALYEATDGPNWVNSENWLTRAPLGEWYGVDTDVSGRVVGLDLAGLWNHETGETAPHGLTGPIPPELGRLVNLERLHLGRNDLVGPIPPELGRLANLEELTLDENDLAGPIPPELGGLANLGTLILFDNKLVGPIPPELGGLANLRELILHSNELSGPIPPELGRLANLRTLILDGNELSGPIPPELGNAVDLVVFSVGGNRLTGVLPREFLNLTELRWVLLSFNEGLCVPGTGSFVEWRGTIGEALWSWCNESDMAVLESFYTATGGPDWRNSTGWLGGPALENWYGVEADLLGRVTALGLADNGLAGGLPAGLGWLAELTELRIGDNEALYGRLPQLLTALSLDVLHYAGTDLCVPADDSFQQWLDGISSHDGTGAGCAPISDRDVLAQLYRSTGGSNWADSDNWLTGAALGEWSGVRVDGNGRVVSINLYGNGLSGPIPPELSALANLRRLDLSENELSGPIPPTLGRLANLELLSLSWNQLSGPIPPALGGLANLRRVDLGWNKLSGPIPPELGDLASLETLILYDNELSGPIPPELGGPANLRELILHGNELSGPIPPELGGLANLRALYLQGNELSGPIPPELGGLANLEELRFQQNDLSGPAPPELGGLSSLRHLELANNPALDGALPSEMMSLARLETLQAGGTGLCAPADPEFRSWLEGVAERWIPWCAQSAAYLTQVVQSREFPVPLVAGRTALLRVFPMARKETEAGIPPMRARFYVDGRETHVEDIPGKSVPVPIKVDEGDLAKSANAEIPGRLVRPGIEMVIEIDPDSTLDPELGVTGRIPEEGRLAIEVGNMPLLDLTLIPFVWTETHDSSIVDLIRQMEEDAEGHDLFGDMRLLPVSGMEVTAHAPVLSSSNNAVTLIGETWAIRAMEGGGGHYMGMMSPPVAGAAGVAYAPGRSSFSVPIASVIAHELGHNMSLLHAPCGHPAGVDPSFPYPDGSVGAWGYDFRDGGLVRPSTDDLMSYCGPQWISDYNFTKALRFRLSDADNEQLPRLASPAKSLLLWGGTGADSAPFLEPAFVVEAPPLLPDSAGEWRLAGRTSGGAELFTLSFAMPEVADAENASGFVFVLPVHPSWEGTLSSIELSGPGGLVTLDGTGDEGMAILRDPRTGQVRGILRDLPATVLTGADARSAVSPAGGLDLLFSRGIPGKDAGWRR